ncbi:MAG: hypothetical protein JWR19_121 [Pedosphaera sp.]|nr:hypothetical protein [Pedosphaera sp.]
MGDGTGLSIPSRHPFAVHEMALATLGLGTMFALLLAGNSSNFVLLEVATAAGLYVAVVFACRDKTNTFQPRIRFLASFAFVLWFYCVVAHVTPALGTKLRDGNLLAIDEAMFGQTPAIFCERIVTARLTDLMSLCYLTYHLYLFVVVLHAALVPNTASQQLSDYLFTGFAIGFAGYLLVPAIGPAFAYPELFKEPLVGGAITRLVAKVVATGSSGYDVFPSLHVMITCILLDHDWRNVRRRFWLMAVPLLGLLASTIYLRFHYGVDLLAALLLFLALRRTFLKAGSREVGLPQ